MRVNDEDEYNVDDQAKDPNSVFSFWKRALQIRKQHEVFVCSVRSFLHSVLDDKFRSTETLSCFSTSTPQFLHIFAPLRTALAL